MKDEIAKMIEILQKAFEVEDIKTENYKEGFFGKEVIKFYIPETNFNNIVKEFPFMKNVVKAGLMTLDKKRKSFFTTSTVLSAKASDKRKMGLKQFFNFDKKDKNDRTTLKDALVSIDNVKKVANKMGLNPKDIHFTIHHKNGNPDEVVNFMELDARIFGRNKEEVDKKLEQINKVVKFKR